jgi:hypothetical protein
MSNQTQIKIDKNCEHFKYHHCLATQSAAHSTLVQFCDQDADYCVKKRKA